MHLFSRSLKPRAEVVDRGGSRRLPKDLANGQASGALHPRQGTNHRLALLAALLCMAVPTSARPQVNGTITGRVVDTEGAPLPGVTITVTVGARDLQTVTDPKGRYALDAVPSGAHTIRATLPGFCPGEKRVDLEPGGSTANFELRTGPLGQIDWIAPPEKLSALVAKVRTVAYVRVTAALEPTGDCDQLAQVRADVIEQLKPAGQSPASLTFWQERWYSEPRAYPVGTQLVVLLVDWNGKLIRSHGPHAVFPIKDGKVQSSRFLFYRTYADMRVEDFLRELRVMK